MLPTTASGRLPPTLVQSLAAAVCLFVLSACTTAPGRIPANLPSPVMEKATTAPHALKDSATHNDIQTWFYTARRLVEQELQVDLSDITVRVVKGDTIKKYARDGLRRALRHDIGNEAFAESLVSDILTSHTASAVLAIYSPEAKAVLLHDNNLSDYLTHVEGRSSEQAALQALLLHELIHAADDIKHRVFDQSDATYQEVFAKSTILEGHAQWQARRLCKFAACSDAFQNLNDYMFNLNSVDDPALSYIQKRNFRNLEFVYREGERFVDHIMQQKNASLLLELAFNQPPRDSLQIIDPSSFPNRGRENRNLQISETIKQSRKPWRPGEKGLLTRNIVAAAAFTAQPETRNPIIEFYTERVTAAAKHEYYDHGSDIPIPIAITVMQTDNDTTAKDTARLIFESTAETYRNLDGQLVEVSQWRRDSHNAVTTDKLLGSVKINMNTAGGSMNNHMVQSEYPFEVVTASSGDFIVHIDGRYHDSNELMQYAGQLLLELRRRSLKQL